MCFIMDIMGDYYVIIVMGGTKKFECAKNGCAKKFYNELFIVCLHSFGNILWITHSLSLSLVLFFPLIIPSWHQCIIAHISQVRFTVLLQLRIPVVRIYIYSTLKPQLFVQNARATAHQLAIIIHINMYICSYLYVYSYVFK